MPTRERGPLEWETYARSFGHRLAAIRRARQLTQEQVSELSGLHRNEISNLERAAGNHGTVTDPTLSTLYQLAFALNVSPFHLLPDADAPVSPHCSEQKTRFAISMVEKEIQDLFGSEQDDPHDPK
ncbi:MAG: helix-turn-helix transcriptional regulator [Gordonia sp. (in: high G+C Gram-positive bacteria)]|uniref:helix-turn-helix domain-containing protein n=1 Tax=Gordonia sp. (in: high G+C Gram-positive bacteria) TaxID=84139 RepID=UPI0039E321D3